MQKNDSITNGGDGGEKRMGTMQQHKVLMTYMENDYCAVSFNLRKEDEFHIW